MIYKGFCRKKSTKLYIIIYTLLIIGISVLILGRNYYISKENELHKNDFLLVENKTNIDLSKIPNIQDYNKSIYMNEYNIVLLPSNNLKDNEIIISNNLSDKIIDNEFMELNYAEKKLKLKVIEASEELKMNCILTSKDLLNKLYKEKDSNYYALNLKNWLKYNKTIDILKNEYEMPSLFYINSSDDNYTDTFNVITIFLILFLFIFIVVGLLTSFNIIRDEKRNNKLYKILGYSKVKIILITMYKLLLILILSVLIGLIISLLFKIYLFR